MKNINSNEIKGAVESILFISKKPISAKEISECNHFEIEIVEKILEELILEYESKSLQIIKLAKGYIMATRPKFSAYIESFLKNPLHITLSPQALETLSIISYRQPIAKPDIENIRGVMCDAVIKSLFEKKLIKEMGRADRIGRPILYGTTQDFLKHFGLNDLSDLPPLDGDGGTGYGVQGTGYESVPHLQ